MITTVAESDEEADVETPPITVDKVEEQLDKDGIAECLLTSQVDFQ